MPSVEVGQNGGRQTHSLILYRSMNCICAWDQTIYLFVL